MTAALEKLSIVSVGGENQGLHIAESFYFVFSSEKVP